MKLKKEKKEKERSSNHNKRKEQIKQKKEAREASRQLRKSNIEEIKKDKEELYALRKNRMLKIARFLIWTMISFMFLKGVIVSLRPDPTAVVNQTIAEFKETFSGYQEQDNEVLAFAEQFAVEYMTYSIQEGQAAYSERLTPFASNAVTNNLHKIEAGSGASVIYAMAYRKEAFSPTQSDVWVYMQIRYIQSTKSPDGIETKLETVESTILKVPVNIQNGRYIVEDLPLFVSDNIKIENFTAKPYSGSETPKQINDEINQALTNFFRAYYEEEQSVINYYLDSSVNQQDFLGLNGRVLFRKIESLRTYPLTETEFLAICTVSIVDTNNTVMIQPINLEITYRDTQYYVRSMNARSINIT